MSKFQVIYTNVCFREIEFRSQAVHKEKIYITITDRESHSVILYNDIAEPLAPENVLICSISASDTQVVRLKYELLTAVPCIMSKTVSPTPRNFSAMDRAVGSDIFEASGLSAMSESNLYPKQDYTDEKPLERLTPAITVETKTASTV
jgi:hypothetical protein